MSNELKNLQVINDVFDKLNSYFTPKQDKSIKKDKITLLEAKNLIEKKLGIENTLKIVGEAIYPNEEFLSIKYVMDSYLDDLFDYRDGKPIFTRRMLGLALEITDDRLIVGTSHFVLGID